MEVALELLDYHYADEKVRTLAVRRIAKISNSELKNFLLQLVQASLFHNTRKILTISNMEGLLAFVCL